MAKGNFGERLKRERELREVSLKELTVGTRISTRYLEAFENEEWNKLPGGVFNRGFVRSMARYLGLDEENLLAEYDLAHGEPTAAPRPYESKIPRPPLWIPVAMVLGALLLLAGLVAGGVYGWHRYAAHRAAKPQGAAAVPSSSAAEGTGAPGTAQTADLSGATSNAAETVPLDLSVSTSAATRVRVLADNVSVLDAEVPAGETRHFSASQQFEVSASNSSAVLLELNGKAMPPIGAPGASGTIVLSQKDLRQASGGTTQP